MFFPNFWVIFWKHNANSYFRVFWETSLISRTEIEALACLTACSETRHVLSRLKNRPECNGRWEMKQDKDEWMAAIHHREINLFLFLSHFIFRCFVISACLFPNTHLGECAGTAVLWASGKCVSECQFPCVTWNRLRELRWGIKELPAKIYKVIQCLKCTFFY